MKAHIKGPSDFKISACTIAKNEENTIPLSIDSYKYFVDEIIVVDTGSSDNTVKVAKEHGAHVYHYEWNNDFAAAKNAALDRATGDWIIFLDADEYFVEGCGKRIREAIVEAEKRGNGSIGCRMLNLNTKTGGIIADIYSVRVMKRGFRYRFAIHEEPYREDGKDILSVDKTWFYLYHTGYTPEIIGDKAQRNLDYMIEQMEKETDITRKTVYKSYLCDSYVNLKNYDKAIESAKSYIEDSEKYNVKLVGCETKPYLNLIISLEEKDADENEIDFWVNKLNEKYPDYPDGVFAQGRLFIRKKMFSSALKMFDKTQELLKNYTDTYPSTIAGNPSELYYNYGVVCEGLLNVPDALSWYFKSFEEKWDIDWAILNLFRLIKNMPEESIDKLAGPLFYGDKIKCKSVLTGLMQNYMPEQILKCYSVYRKNKSEFPDTNVSAFIMAGKGDYEGATKMFLAAYSILKDSDTAIRGLVCAALSGKEDLIEGCSANCTPSQLFALGLTQDCGDEKPDIKVIAKAISEMSVLKGGACAAEMAKKVAYALNEKELSLLVIKLGSSYAFDAALAVAQCEDITPEAVFTQGYLLYRLRRFSEAADLLDLAKHMGYDKPELYEIYDNLQKLRAQKPKIAHNDETLKQRIEHEIERGLYNEALEDILKYKQLADPDSDMYAAEAAVLYYNGEYKKSAIAAQSGLLKDGNNFDLLYNLGCIYEKLGELPRAASMYQRALENCESGAVADDIKQSLKLIGEKSGK